MARQRQGSARGGGQQKALPGFTVQTFLGFQLSDDPTFVAQFQRMAEGLGKAGVPEGEAAAR